MDQILTITGLLINLAGVILLFLFGMPFHVPTRGRIPLVLEQEDEAGLRVEKRNVVLGWIGLGAIVVGTFLQVWAAL